MLKSLGRTTRGYEIFVEDNEVGGRRYWSDEIGGGVVVWDTALVDMSSLLFAIDREKEISFREGLDEPVRGDAQGM
jgi:hypothetical protein